MVARRSKLIPQVAAWTIGALLLLCSGRLPLIPNIVASPDSARTPVAAVKPPEHWDVFLPERRPIYMAIDEWIVENYNQGTYQAILDAFDSFLPHPGNDAAKILATMYVYSSERWELARLLIPAINPAISTPTVRYNALCCLRYALKDTGAEFFNSDDRSLLEAYVQSGLETQSGCISSSGSVLAHMIRLGL